VVGITLPFLTGGSSMLALLTSIGLLMNVSMRRYRVSLAAHRRSTRARRQPCR
jgi:cell division protein FtsW (lipid II flippase)